MTKQDKFLLDNIDEVRELKEKQGLTHMEVAQYFTTPELDITALQVGNFCRKNRIISLGARISNKGDRNPSRRPEVRNKISDSVAKLWSDGIYDDRINGMLGKKGLRNPNFSFASYSKRRYDEKYKFYLGDRPFVCERCGKSLDNCKWNIHHIDENHNNSLLTNLQALCITCHQKFHYSVHKRPYISVSRLFLLECSHFLPEYPGKCFWTHGHRYEVEIEVTRRIDPDTGMVLDFHDFKDIVEEHLVYNFDHAMLNDFIINPTSERFILLIWKTLSPYLKGITKITLHESRDTKLSLTYKEVLELVNNGDLESEWFSMFDGYEEYFENEDS